MDEQRIREIVREELDDGPQTDRRSMLKALGLAGAGAAAGAAGRVGLTGSAKAADTGTAVVGEAGDAADVYLDRLLDDGGDAVLDVDDTGAIAGQNGRPWDFPAVQTDDIDTREPFDNARNLSYMVSQGSASGIYDAANTAISELSPRGGILFVEPGLYAPSTVLDLSPGVNNQDANTTLKFVGLSAKSPKFDYGVTINHGNNFSSGPAIKMDGGWRRNVQFEGINFRGAVQHFQIADSGNQGIDDWKFVDCQFKSGTPSFGGDADMIRSKFVDCDFTGNGRAFGWTSGDWNVDEFRACQFLPGSDPDFVDFTGTKIEKVAFNDCEIASGSENFCNFAGELRGVEIDAYVENMNTTANAGNAVFEIPGNVFASEASLTEKTTGSGPLFDFSGEVRQFEIADSNIETTGINLLEYSGSGSIGGVTIRQSDLHCNVDLSTINQYAELWMNNIRGTFTQPTNGSYARKDWDGSNNVSR